MATNGNSGTLFSIEPQSQFALTFGRIGNGSPTHLTDLYLPFALLGILNPATAQLALLAAASDSRPSAQADPLPTNLRVGLAAHAINNKYNKLTFVADVNKTMVKRYQDGTSDPFYKAIFTSPWVEKKSERNGYRISFGLMPMETELIAPLILPCPV